MVYWVYSWTEGPQFNPEKEREGKGVGRRERGEWEGKKEEEGEEEEGEKEEVDKERRKVRK